MKPWQKLKQFWEETGANIGVSPCDLGAIEALENKYDIRLPGDFREFLQNACPATGMEVDENVTDWWCYERLASVTEEYEYDLRFEPVAKDPNRYIFFAGGIL